MKSINRVTPDNITELKPNEIFVFGDNTKHLHGAGAAKTAMKWGAKYFKGGLQGQTYGIPTKDGNFKVLTLDKIQGYVDIFIEFAKTRLDLVFLVTEIGCGLANFKPKEIAPLFKEAINIDNIHLPERFWYKLNQ